MAQNLKINGKQYNGVSVIGAPNANGGTSRFFDTSNATADADDIAIGKTAYTINGKITGTNQGGGSTLGTKTITSNGEYDAQDDGYDGYSSVDVQVPGSSPTLQSKTNIAPTTSSQTITADQGYDGLSSVQINAMPTGTAGTPTATKGAVSNHSISVTPSVTNSAGYISSGTINGTAVSVSASELDSGAKSITANGNSQDVVGYASVNVNVPNTYSAGDEGKVVSSGALVAQTSDTVTTNDTYDTTLINSLTVNVSGGGGLSTDDVIERTNFPATITYDGTKKPTDYVFMDCATIQSFTASKKIDIASGMFYRCTGLQSASFPLSETNNQSCNSCFYNCTSLQSLNIPKVIMLGQNALQNCTSLHTLVAPKMTGLRNGFASGAGLQQVDLPVCGAINGNEHFKNNSGLTILVLRKTSVCTLGNINSFTGTPFASDGTGGTLYVPNSLLSSYQSASNWTTILGYANNSIKSIESTHTDPNAPIDLTTHYADGTVIPT